MNRSIVSQFRVESRHKLFALTSSNNMTVYGREYLYTLANLLDIRSTNEDHLRLTDVRHLSLSHETAQLTPISIATHLDVHRSKVSTIEHDEASTRAKHRQPSLNIALHRLIETKVANDTHHSRTLTPRYNQTVLRLIPIRELTHEKRLHPKTREHLLVFGKCSL